MKLSTPATRFCPECNEFGLEITENLNIYECKICGSVWRRLRPINVNGKMVDMPDKLKKLFPSLENIKEEEITKLFEKRCSEFDNAWEIFFKDKPEPKNDKEDVIQQKEFSKWYNYIRKQSDTNLTPKEMFDKGMENRIMEFVEDEEDGF